MSEREPLPSKGADKIWFICSDNEEIKTKLMNLIIKLRLKKQHEVGLWFRKSAPPKKPNVSGILGNKDEEDDSGKKTGPLDGYWVLLQDWSSCTKKCGGGLQYQHNMCIPPKAGGKPCEGPDVKTKPCNEQPCPNINSDSSDATSLQKSGAKEKIEKPIVRMLPISSRPLRYDKCHLKEGDTIFTKFVPGVGIKNNPMKVPARIVMNEKSVSIYTDETLLTELGTFILDNTTFKLAENTNCFILDSQAMKGEFCNLETSNKASFVEEWNYDFNLFKIQCHTDRKVVALNDRDEKELQQELEKKIDSAKMDVVRERQKKIQQKVQETPITKVEKLQETAMLAMKKELTIDGLLQKEENEREEAETRELRIQLESEKKKDECLIKSIKEKELEDQYNLSKSQQDKEMNEMKEQAKQQILMKRKQVKLKIMQMRKRSERKKKLLNGELQALRTQVASELNNVSKEGDMNKCFKPTKSKEDEDKVMDYCKEKFMDSSPLKFNECKSEATFCYVCCESEFGDMHVKERDHCYDKCDEDNSKEAKKNGAWQWVETVGSK